MQKRSYLITAIVIGVIFLFILFGGNKVKKEAPSNPSVEKGIDVATSSDSINNATGSEAQTSLPVSQ
ncbi:MAG: hypothetical protein AAB738_02675 [Patescibacteria group bacterium]